MDINHVRQLRVKNPETVDDHLMVRVLELQLEQEQYKLQNMERNIEYRKKLIELMKSRDK